MQQINHGFTSTDKLLYYLEDYFNVSDEEMKEQIAYLENHKGNWTIGFTSHPRQNLVLYIFAIFENKLDYDGIDTISFNYGTAKEKSFTSVAGCLGNKIAEVLAYVEKNKVVA